MVAHGHGLVGRSLLAGGIGTQHLSFLDTSLMYKRRFHLDKSPFAMTPDPDLLYLTSAHREALSGLAYSLMERKGFVVLTGEAGTGKTTLLSRLLQHAEDTAHFSLVLNPTLNSDEFLESALEDFGITEIPSSKVHRLQKLHHFLIASHLKGKTCVLVVDEAQKLAPDVLEEIRLLTNFETADQKLLQIVLVGQDELRNILNREDLRQLKQRIAFRFELKPLSSGEIDAYLHHRWLTAGGGELPFEQDAIRLIERASRGIPRVINSICDNALLLIYASEAPTVTAQDVRQVMADLDLREGVAAANHFVEAPGSRTIPKGNSFYRTVPVPSTLHIPKPVGMPAVLSPMRLTSLDRYLPREPKASLWLRWAERLGIGNLQRRTS